MLKREITKIMLELKQIKILLKDKNNIEIDDNSDVNKMIEKPEYNFLVNTGMYILEPEVFEDIPENKFFHITELINDYIQKGEKIAVYPVSEGAWLDMGQFKEMEIMLDRLGVK